MHLFELTPVRDDLAIERLPLFYRANSIVYYGPHPSVVKGKEHVRVGQKFPEHKDLEMLQLYESSSRLGWSLVMAVPKVEYDAEAKKWWRQFAFISAISLCIGLFSITVIRRMVYSPLRLIGKEMGMFTGQKTDFPRVRTGMEEFDLLLNRFYDMRGTLIELIEEIERKEKHRGELEVEKLLVQINPHFLHNTLNTVQWLARIHGQPQIDRLVSIFTRVLHYNLGKQSIIVRLRQEVEVLQDYVELQNIRYNHSFQVKVNVDPELLDVPIPRFILQPLVENALYHGLPDYNGYISVQIRRIGENRLEMCVRDNGAGMSTERQHQLLNEEDQNERKSGLGIGLRYIVKLLDVYYKNQATFHIESEVNKGTTITMVLPLALEGVRFDDQSNDRG